MKNATFTPATTIMGGKNMKKEYETIQESKTTVTSMELDGVNELRVEKTTITYEVIYEVNAKTGKRKKVSEKQVGEPRKKIISYSLRETTAEELAELRFREIPTFVLKDGDKLYQVAVPKETNMMSFKILGEHQCGANCNRMHALPEEKGGCSKVRDHGRNKKIEKYSFIKLGYETFSTKSDVLVVAKCSQYEKAPAPRRMTAEEVTRAKLSLAQFVWPEVTTIAEVRQRKNRNR